MNPAPFYLLDNANNSREYSLLVLRGQIATANH